MSEYGDTANVTGSLIVDGDVDLGSGDDDIDMDAGTLFVDATADFVGVGTEAPISKLDVAGKISISTEVSTPTAPSDGKGWLYTKTDGKIYWQSYDVSETDLTSGGSGGGISWDGNTVNGVATFKDADEATVESNLTFDGSTLTVTGDLEVNGTIHTPIDSLTLADTVDTDASTGNIFTVTLTGSNLVTLANPTNLEDGAAYSWIIKQDSSGGSDLLFGDSFIFKNGLPPSMMSASLSVNILEGVSDGTSVYLLSNTALTSSANGDPREILRTIGNDSTISYWYDASDSDHITKDGSDLVATWADKSGNGRDATQATSGYKPTWTDNTIGGLPAIVFDGTNDILNLAGGQDGPLEGDNIYIFIVAQTDDGSGDANLFGVGSSSPGYVLSWGEGIALDEGKPLVKSVANTVGVMIKGASSVADDHPFVLRGVLRDENSSLFVNGVVVGTDTSNDPTPHTLYTIAAIGGSNGSGGAGTDFFDGAIGEILCFTGSPLSDEEVRTIEKYLVYKWSLEDHYRS